MCCHSLYYAKFNWSFSYDIQSWTFAYIRFLKKPYVNGVTLREQNSPLKCCQPVQLITYSERGLTYFNTGNMRSVGQMASKLSSVKL